MSTDSLAKFRRVCQASCQDRRDSSGDASGVTVGSFDALVSTSNSFIRGGTFQEIYVTHVDADADPNATPRVGTLFVGHSGQEGLVRPRLHRDALGHRQRAFDHDIDALPGLPRAFSL